MGNGISLPPKLRPVFIQRFEEIRARRHVNQIKAGTTLSKKELLLRDDDVASSCDHESSYHNIVKYHEPDRVKTKQETPCNNYDAKRHEVAKEDLKIIVDENLTDYEDADDANNDDPRRIGHEGDDSFPGSPSFRVYFQDDGNDDHNGNNNIGFGDRKAPSEDSTLAQDPGLSKKVKKGKKRSFKMVLPKGGQAAVKNLLNVKSCCTSPNTHHPARLVSGKSDT